MLMTPDNRAAVLRDRLIAFVADRFPFAIAVAGDAFERAVRDRPLRTAEDVQRLRPGLRQALQSAIRWPSGTAGLETTPGVSAADRLPLAAAELIEACDGVLWREEIALGLSSDERREILRGMVLTRATDNRLKAFFTSGEVKYRGAGFQGKGFRSLGQEAIYAAAMRLRRGPRWRGADGQWQGDIVAPLIRDAGAALAMRPEPETVRMILNAQMAKAGPPMDGRDLNIGDMAWGILPAAAPLAIATMMTAGLGFAFDRRRDERVAVSFIGEGGASLGEWHEAINLCAVRRLPVIFCVQNNQTALSTPVAEQSRARVFADRAAGYGVPGVTIDGTDPDAIAGAFGWAADRARAGHGPTLVELVSMRICGHAHHDDMLYLGKDPQPSWDYPPLFPHGYADPDLFGFWSQRDPIVTYSRTLEREGVIAAGDLDRIKSEAEAIVEAEAAAIVATPWPDPSCVTVGVLADDVVERRRVEVLTTRTDSDRHDAAAAVETGPPFTPKGATFLEGVMLGVKDALASDPRAFVFGEDVGGKYGNAFLLLRPLLGEFGDRIVNAPLTEGGVLGVCIGAALAGLRPIGEMQFNDFVATGFNQLVNSAAKIRYRWGGSVPMVVRMPWGGLRHAGPYHSQNTEAWFYRTPGLKIVAPSTPHDARALMASAVADADPVLYYEHIALYRDPRIKQSLDVPPVSVPIGKAALRRAGGDLAIISYGAYVHVALRVAARLAESGIEASVLDLRSLAPLDRAAVLGLARRIGKVLIVHEDSRTGGIGESLAAVIQEEAFDWLDAPIRVIGALDTPVPYSPALEDAFLPSEQDIETAARLLVAY
jgi:2-oxoisovalerate dehydrogenase E1 component